MTELRTCRKCEWGGEQTECKHIEGVDIYLCPKCRSPTGESQGSQVEDGDTLVVHELRENVESGTIEDTEWVREAIVGCDDPELLREAAKLVKYGSQFHNFICDARNETIEEQSPGVPDDFNWDPDIVTPSGEPVEAGNDHPLVDNKESQHGTDPSDSDRRGLSYGNT